MDKGGSGGGAKCNRFLDRLSKAIDQDLFLGWIWSVREMNEMKVTLAFAVSHWKDKVGIYCDRNMNRNRLRVEDHTFV